MSPVDMSPEAITRRLRKAAQLRGLCRELGKARPLAEAEANEPPPRDEAGHSKER